MNETNINSYKSTRVFIAPSGEFLLALPIFADEKGSIFDKSEMEQMSGMSVSVGFYDHIGYIVYHPDIGECVMSRDVITKNKPLFEDLGPLND